MVTVHLDDTLREIEGRFRLTEAELDRAFQRAQRRAVGAGRSRVLRQMKRLTGEGKLMVYLRPRLRRGQTSVPRDQWQELPPDDPQAARFTRNLTGNRDHWIRNRVYSGVRHTGEGRIWVGLNPRVGRGGRVILEYPDLESEFDADLVQNTMETVFEAEIEKAAIQAISR